MGMKFHCLSIIKVVFPSVSEWEEDFALVIQQATVAHSLIMTLVLVWITAQPLIPTLDPMGTSFVVSIRI